MKVQLVVTFTVDEGAWADEYGDDVSERTITEILTDAQEYGQLIGNATSGLHTAATNVISIAREVTE